MDSLLGQSATGFRLRRLGGSSQRRAEYHRYDCAEYNYKPDDGQQEWEGHGEKNQADEGEDGWDDKGGEGQGHGGYGERGNDGAGRTAKEFRGYNRFGYVLRFTEAQLQQARAGSR